MRLLDLSAECKTISVGADNGFLPCAKTFFGNPPGNDKTIEAVSNLVICSGGKRKTSMIIGHGNSGFIKTGSGDHGGTDDQFLGSWNRPKWLPHVRNLKDKCLNLQLLGCDTGADEVGADLTYYVATAIQAVVLAPTYLVWCRGGGGPVYLDPKAKWQTAYPGIRPTPIPKPTLVRLAEVLYMRLPIGNGQYATVPLDSVSHVVVHRFSFAGRQTQQSLSGDDATNLLSQIDLDNPFVPGANPAAMLTARIEISFSSDSGQGPGTRTLLIYNDELAEDDAHRGTFYYATAGLQTLMGQLI